MNHLLRNKSVFFTLIVLGICLLGLAVLFSKYVPTPLKNFFIPLCIGIIMGSIVCLLEVFCFRKKRGVNYRPSIAPYLVMWIILILNILFPNFVRFYLCLVFGSYLITLATCFRVYEIKKDQKWMTWNDLLAE